MKHVFSASISKDIDEPQLNEDRIRYSKSKSIFCVSDGASVSFDSGSWARILTKAFIENPVLDENWITKGYKEFSTKHDYNSLSWNQQAAWDRGSFATLAGCYIGSVDKVVKATCIGDSIVILINEGRLLNSFSYEKAWQFQQDPLLISTIPERNNLSLSPENIAACTIEWSLDGLNSPALFVMTDALGEWLLGAPEKRIDVLLSLGSVEKFKSLVVAERIAKQLRTDDTSILVCR